jgi:hypothetical protein
MVVLSFCKESNIKEDLQLNEKFGKSLGEKCQKIHIAY